jgi:hypothetical protein
VEPAVPVEPSSTTASAVGATAAYVERPECCVLSRYGPCAHEQLDFEASDEEGEEE